MEENEASKPGLWTNFTETTGFHGLNKVKFDKKYPGQVIRRTTRVYDYLYQSENILRLPVSVRKDFTLPVSVRKDFTITCISQKRFYDYLYQSEKILRLPVSVRKDFMITCISQKRFYDYLYQSEKILRLPVSVRKDFTITCISQKRFYDYLYQSEKILRLPVSKRFYDYLYQSEKILRLLVSVRKDFTITCISQKRFYDYLYQSQKILRLPVSIRKDFPITCISQKRFYDYLYQSEKILRLPVSVRKDFTLPVPVRKDFTLPISVRKDFALSVSVRKDFTLSVSVRKDFTLSVSVRKDFTITCISQKRFYISYISQNRFYDNLFHVCWAVVWLASAAVLIYIITTELINYYSYPWVSTTYIRLDQEAQFPVVTLSVCEGDTLDLSFTSFSFDRGSVNISDVPVVEYTDFTTYGMVDNGCTSRRFNANGKMLTREHGKHTNLQIETRAKEIQIAVHTPPEEPDMYSESITVGQDTYTYIELHRREDIALPSPFISDGTMCLENYDYFDCNQNGTHCVDTPADKACSDELITKESSAICLAACPPQCKVITYDVIVSSRTSNYGDDVPNMFIRIFLKDFKTTVTEQVPKYDGLTSLLGKDIFSFHFDRLVGFIGR
ncbi:unnamed protein product [Mytilus edulis]|uniref:Uncharacterized protein n=1 Tax=Mytilus edulis TaxID=6550 RepID=A0A8S3VIJ9_MYTED|nr:unnamed protein product [Mytilus edulis]